MDEIRVNAFLAMTKNIGINLFIIKVRELICVMSLIHFNLNFIFNCIMSNVS